MGIAFYINFIRIIVRNNINVTIMHSSGHAGRIPAEVMVCIQTVQKIHVLRGHFEIENACIFLHMLWSGGFGNDACTYIIIHSKHE